MFYRGLGPMISEAGGEQSYRESTERRWKSAVADEPRPNPAARPVPRPVARRRRGGFDGGTGGGRFGSRLFTQLLETLERPAS